MLMIIIVRNAEGYRKMHKLTTILKQHQWFDREVSILLSTETGVLGKLIFVGLDHLTLKRGQLITIVPFGQIVSIECKEKRDSHGQPPL